MKDFDMKRHCKMEPGKKDSNPQTDDLKSMLMTFRISELQEVLCTCGRPRSGRKHELLGRALSLLKQSEGSSLRERVKNRIIELYKVRFPNRVLPASLSSQSLYTSTEQSEKSSDRVQSNTPGVISQKATSSSTNNPGGKDRETVYGRQEANLPHATEKSNNMETYRDISNSLTRKTNHVPPRGTAMENINKPAMHPLGHVNGTGDRYRVNDSSSCHDGMPVHPDVRFIKLPFAEIQDILIKPTSLGQKRMTGYQHIQLVFHLSPLQVQTITQSKSYTLQSRVEFGVQVLLRFCLAETSCQQEDAYPSRCTIKVNGKICPIPGQPPPNSQNMEPKKPHRPVNITSFCRLSPMIANQVQVSWLPSDLGQRYAATVQLVKCVTASSLTSRLKAKPERNADHSRALIKEKLAHDPDIEVATTSLKVSLCCPIGKTRMTLPCRATTCNHVQCFDGSLYIQMNERKPNWTCPVCDKKAYYDQLIVDGLLTEILRAAPDSNDIVFSQDGSWKPLSEIEQDTKTTITTIVGTPADTKKTEEKYKDKEVDMIDLTGDSSDDEESNQTSTRPMNYQPPVSQQRGPRVRQVPLFQPSSLPVPYPHLFDPDPQGPDFYSMLPDEDRMAAELYLAQSGFLSQLTGSRHSPSDVISLD